MRNKHFRNQFLASAMSMVGSALTPVALSFGVLEATGSIADLGFVLTAYSVAQTLFMLAGGVWADRLPRQLLMMTADGIRVLTQIAFGVMLLLGHPNLWTMITLQLLCGAATALFLPASVGLVADTAPPGLIQEANALLALTRNLTGTIGPIVAGTLVVATGAGWGLVIDGATFLASLLFLSRVQLPARQAQPTRGGFLGELREGWLEVARRSWVWSSILYFMLFNLMFAAFQVLGPALMSGDDNGGTLWGVVVAALGAGQLLGNSLAVWLKPRKPLFAGRLIMLLAAPLLLLLGAEAGMAALVVGAILAGIAISLPDTLWDTALQQHVPTESLSRVSSFDYLGSMILRPLGLAMAAIVATHIGTRATLIGSAAVIVLTSVLSLLNREVRTFERSENRIGMESDLSTGQ
ncbi:MFS transporter [Streptomyces sp. NPDC003483]